jgi:hypothetical protein
MLSQVWRSCFFLISSLLSQKHQGKKKEVEYTKALSKLVFIILLFNTLHFIFATLRFNFITTFTGFFLLTWLLLFITDGSSRLFLS